MCEIKVSVIIPVYNAEKYLKQCLDTVINQTLKDIEIICVDDGSTDKSLDILKEYQENDNRIIILQQQNQHAGVARNNGLKVAKGKYLSFLDSDDFFELTMLDEMYNKAEKDNSDIVICGWKNFDNVLKKVTTTFKINSKYIARSPLLTRNNTDDIFMIGKPNPWTKLFKHDLFRNNNLLFEEYVCCNDLTCVCMALALSNKISVINKEFIYYRNNQTTNISAGRSKNFDCTLLAINELEKKLKTQGLFKTFYTTFINRCKAAIGKNKTLQRKNLAKRILSGELYNILYEDCKVKKIIKVTPRKKNKFF